MWPEGILRQHITRLITATESATRQPADRLRAVDADELMLRVNYAQQYSGIERRQTLQRLAREVAFEETAQPVEDAFRRATTTPAEARLLQSAYVDLYWLTVAGGLQKIAGKKANSLSIDQKVTLAERYLAQNRRKSKERQMVARRPVITVGYEIENHPALPNLIYRIYKDEEKGSDALKSRHSGLLGTILVPNAYYATYDISPVTSTIGDLTDYDDEAAKGSAELGTAPSASPRTQLRELVQIARSGGLEGRWVIHETVTGVKLDREHIEIMDVYPMAIAAGFMDTRPLTAKRRDRILTNMQRKQQGRDRSSSVSGERYAKDSTLEDGTFYFPYHKVRQTNETEKYLSEKEHTHAVEMRSMPGYQPGHFSKFVRKASFSYLASWGIRAVQTKQPLLQRDISLAQAWRQLQNEWNALLQNKSLYGTRGPIHNPTSAERYIRTSQYYDIPSGTTEYEHFIDRMKLESQTNPAFRRRAHAMITRYNRAVKAIIGY